MEADPHDNPYDTGLIITNQANAFQNLAITASVCLCGSDGSFDSMGEAMFCNFESRGSVVVDNSATLSEPPAVHQ